MKLGILFLLISNVFFALMPLLVKEVMSFGLMAPQIAFIRFSIGVLVVLFYHILFRRLQFHHFRILFFRGLFGGMSVLLYFLSIQGVSPGIATLFNYSWPAFAVPLSALILKEHVSLHSVIALFLTCLGMVGITWDAGFLQKYTGLSTMVYVVCGVGSALFSGAAVITIRSARQSEGYWELFFFFCLVGSLITAIPGISAWKWPCEVAWVYLVGIGFSSVIAQLCMTYALKEVPTWMSSFLLLFTPVITLFCGILFFQEKLTWINVLSSFLTLFGISYGMYFGKRPISTSNKS